MNPYNFIKLHLGLETENILMAPQISKIASLLFITGCVGRAMVLGNFQCRGDLLISIILGQQPVLFGVGSGMGYLSIFFLSSVVSLYSPALCLEDS